VVTRYRTIVADPPWDHSDGTGVDLRGGGGITHLPYPTMTLDEIRALPVDDLAARRQAHLYLWTTSRYLESAYSVARAWRFEPSAVLVWCKPPRGWMVGGTFASNVEFILFASRNDGDEARAHLGRWLRQQRRAAGLRQKEVAAHWPSRTGGLTGCVANWELGLNAPTLKQWADLKLIIGFGDAMDGEIRRLNDEKGTLLRLGSSDTRWFTWPRGEHSAKPDAFLDLVEQVSPGPYLELFARRQRLGWDTWGNEALDHVPALGAS
jgi:N6-adenosine-specific RNA methylase IME4